MGSSNSVGQIALDLGLNSAGFNKQLSGINSMANKASGAISSSFKKIAAAAAAAFSVKAIVNFGQECIKAAGVQTEAETKLTTVMRQRMNATDETVQSVKDYASAQQELGVVGDEVQLSGAQQLSTFLKTDDALKTLIPAMNNLAAQQNGVNVSAESMTNIGNLMGKAMQGQTAALTRVGITFSEAQEQVLKYGNEQERAAMLAQVITENVGEMNKALASTPAGKMQQIKNSFGDTMETLGRALNNVFAPLLDYVKVIISKFAELSNAFESFTKQMFGDSNTAQYSGVSSDLSDASESADGLSDSADNSAASIKATANEAKKLKNQLAGFDQLNVLSGSDDESADDEATQSTGTGPAINAGSIQKSSEAAANGFVDNIKNAFNDLYKRSGAENFVNEIIKGVNSVDWNSIAYNCKSSFGSFKFIAKEAFKGVEKIGKSSMTTLGKFIGGAVKVGGKQLQTITGGVSKWLAKDQNKIASGINTISENISSGIDNIGTFYDKIFTTLGNSVDRVRPTMEQAISDFLSGFTDLGLGIGTVFSGGFEVATQKLSEWVTKNNEEIGLFFDNIQLSGAEAMTTIGGVMSDIGTALTDWWTKEGGGAQIFGNVCEMFTNIGTTFMNIYNEWIKPAWDFIVGVVQSAWENWIKPVFTQAIEFFGKLWNCIATLWNNWLSPLVNWLVDFFGPIFINVFNAVKGGIDTVFSFVGGIVSGILKSLGGLLDFITGVFSGNWEKAWKGIGDFFGGIWDGIITVVRTIVNLIIDGINLLWTGIYNAIKGIVDTIGGVAGAIGSIFGQDWGFSMPDSPTLIPKWEDKKTPALANGGLVKAPTLALVGDNKGAGSGNPEVIAPLNKLQGMLDVSGDNSQVVTLLGKIYELLLAFIGNGGNVYEFVAELDGNSIFKEMINQNNMYIKSHRGHSAFEGAR